MPILLPRPSGTPSTIEGELEPRRHCGAVARENNTNERQYVQIRVIRGDNIFVILQQILCPPNNADIEHTSLKKKLKKKII